jgi:hypothetical protein
MPNTRKKPKNVLVWQVTTPTMVKIKIFEKKNCWSLKFCNKFHFWNPGKKIMQTWILKKFFNYFFRRTYSCFCQLQQAPKN